MQISIIQVRILWRIAHHIQTWELKVFLIDLSHHNTTTSKCPTNTS
jgi:hypothetical protein